MPEELILPNLPFTCLIVTYNSIHEISDLLEDLALHTPSSPVIVIDNASQDGTAELIARKYPYVHLVCNHENAGYARAVNQGETFCDTPYILLLNPDIRIPMGSIFMDMLACLQRPRTAVAAPLQLMKSRRGLRLKFTWSFWAPQSFKLYLAYRFNLPLEAVDPVKVSFLNAGCLFLRRDAFERVGKFNEKYFLYGEEPDLFLKLKYFGYDSWLVPNASIIHHRERSMRQVKHLQRLQIRLNAVHNIADALINGWSNIFLDRITRTPILNGAIISGIRARIKGIWADKWVNSEKE
jgi:N-acetylglucosaminyl-diphospho-decaprenol L-rhamnosyltransferase